MLSTGHNHLDKL